MSRQPVELTNYFSHSLGNYVLCMHCVMAHGLHAHNVHSMKASVPAHICHLTPNNSDAPCNSLQPGQRDVPLRGNVEAQNLCWHGSKKGNPIQAPPPGGLGPETCSI